MQGLRGAIVASGTIAATAGWLGWSFGAGGDPKQALGSGAGPLFVFGLSSIAVWFVALPFLQARLRGNSFPLPGPSRDVRPRISCSAGPNLWANWGAMGGA